MPPPDAILTGLTTITNDFRWLAAAWHGAAFLLLVELAAGWRPRDRLLGCLVVLPLVSVSVLAWLSGNPFNGAVFLVFAAALAGTTRRFPGEVVRIGSPAWTVSGAALVAFGLVYPHFLATDTWAAYLLLSPFGLLPCPTLSVLVGLTMVFRGFHSTLWTATVAMAGLLYGAMGVFRLGVGLDWVLLLGAGVLVPAMRRSQAAWRSVRADSRERRRSLPGDELIPTSAGALTHAVTIAGAPRDVWPWLAQMGAGSRGGWYSYDLLDNGRHPSADRVRPELQHIGLGTVFAALPGVTEGFRVLAFEVERSLVLGWPGPDGEPLVTWAFLLDARAPKTTRLIVRARAGKGYRFRGLPTWLSLPLVRLVHFIMERRQLLGIARRVERASPAQRKGKWTPAFGRHGA